MISYHRSPIMWRYRMNDSAPYSYTGGEPMPIYLEDGKEPYMWRVAAQYGIFVFTKEKPEPLFDSPTAKGDEK